MTGARAAGGRLESRPQFGAVVKAMGASGWGDIARLPPEVASSRMRADSFKRFDMLMRSLLSAPLFRTSLQDTLMGR